MDLGQNPLRDIRSETPSNIFKGLIHKATRKRSKSLDSNAVRSTEPVVESRRDHPMQLGARPKIRQSRQVATTAQVLRKDSDGGKKSLARIDPLALDNSERERLILAISNMPNGSQALGIAYDKLEKGENVDLVALERALRRTNRSQNPRPSILSKSIGRSQKNTQLTKESEHNNENARMIEMGEIHHPDEIIPFGYSTNYCPPDENPNEFRRKQRREYATAMSISLLSNDRTRRDSERDTLGGCSMNSETREYLDPFGPTRVGSLFNYQEKDNCSTEKCETEFIRHNSMAEDYDRNKDHRRAMLEISLDDRTPRFCLVEPPRVFRKGRESIMCSRDPWRVEAVKFAFSTINGNKRFNGAPGKPGVINETQMDVVEMLELATNAQKEVQLTEYEFVKQLLNACAYPAAAAMQTYARYHSKGLMSIREIYLSLCDLFFWDLRPAAALEKLQSLNENSHLFKNVAEAAITLTRWAKLASLASPNYGSQRILMHTYFRDAFVKIMPRELKVHITTRIEEIAGLKGDDLDPIELVKALSRYRNFVDTSFEKAIATKKRRNNQNQIKKVNNNAAQATATQNAPAPLLALPAPTTPAQTPAESDTGKTKQTGKKGGKKNEGKTKAAKAAKANQPSSNGSNANAGPSYSGNSSAQCKLCGNSSHKSNECPLFPGERGNVANYECRKCKAKLFHFCLLYTSPSPRDGLLSRMPSSA